MQRREDDWYRVGEEHTYRPPQPKKDNDEEGPPSDQKSGFHFIGPDLKNHNMRIIVGLLTMIVGILLYNRRDVVVWVNHCRFCMVYVRCSRKSMADIVLHPTIPVFTQPSLSSFTPNHPASGL